MLYASHLQTKFVNPHAWVFLAWPTCDHIKLLTTREVDTVSETEILFGAGSLSSRIEKALMLLPSRGLCCAEKVIANLVAFTTARYRWQDCWV